MGIHQVNTTAYHPQTDGLVERFNRTMTDMLAKTVDKSGRDWDVRLPYVLFAYRTSMQESTRESPFYLLYGRDPQLPTEAALTVPQSRELMDVDSYKTELVCSLADAWKLAQDNVKKAQKRQKTSYDRSARLPKFTVGDRVFLYMPAAKSTKAYKFAKPFRGPYRIVKLYENGAELLPVEHPKATPIRVAMNRLRSCPVELMGVAEPLTSGTDEGLSSTKKSVNSSDAPADQSKESEKSADVPGVWANRLRSWKNPVRDDSAKDGDM